MDWYNFEADEAHRKRERAKAKELRKSPWWKRQLAKGFCHYCEARFSSAELTMDHIVPVARGGKTTKGNVVAACKTCNSKKAYHTPVDQLLED